MLILRRAAALIACLWFIGCSVPGAGQPSSSSPARDDRQQAIAHARDLVNNSENVVEASDALAALEQNGASDADLASGHAAVGIHYIHTQDWKLAAPELEKADSLSRGRFQGIARITREFEQFPDKFKPIVKSERTLLQAFQEFERGSFKSSGLLANEALHSVPNGPNQTEILRAKICLLIYAACRYQAVLSGTPVGEKLRDFPMGIRALHPSPEILTALDFVESDGDHQTSIQLIQRVVAEDQSFLAVFDK